MCSADGSAVVCPGTASLKVIKGTVPLGKAALKMLRTPCRMLERPFWLCCVSSFQQNKINKTMKKSEKIEQKKLIIFLCFCCCFCCLNHLQGVRKILPYAKVKKIFLTLNMRINRMINELWKLQRKYLRKKGIRQYFPNTLYFDFLLDVKC